MKYPSSKLSEWIISLLFAVLLFFITIWLITTIYLPIYTRHGKEVEVPYVIGLESDEAARIITERNLRYTFLGRGKYVIKTIPEPGSRVKEGRVIELTLKDERFEE